MSVQIYNLPEFAEQHFVSDIYGASVAFLDMNQDFVERVGQEPVMVNFYGVVLMIYGTADYSISRHKLSLSMHDMMVIPPHRTIAHLGCSPRAAAVYLLVEAGYFEQLLKMDENLRGTIPLEIFEIHPIFHLDESKASELYDHFQQIRKAIQQPHIYKDEMLKYQIHILQLFLAEQLYGDNVATHDLKHKENIFKIFMYLAAQNYRTERQVKFYADKLNITTAYLSRTVREISGNTVYGYLSSFLYNEACRLLKTTSKTIGEIADELSFNDQSAFTNFFKQKAGISPLAYRVKK